MWQSWRRMQLPLELIITPAEDFSTKLRPPSRWPFLTEEEAS
jgi:hypothetical protein